MTGRRDCKPWTVCSQGFCYLGGMFPRFVARNAQQICTKTLCNSLSRLPFSGSSNSPCKRQKACLSGHSLLCSNLGSKMAERDIFKNATDLRLFQKRNIWNKQRTAKPSKHFVVKMNREDSRKQIGKEIPSRHKNHKKEVRNPLSAFLPWQLSSQLE